MDKLTPDPTLLDSFPEDVLFSARLLSGWFRENGNQGFELYGICSRDRVINPNLKLKAEIRSLRRKLEDANRGAETAAHALYHCSQRRHESSELAHKLGQELDKLKGKI